MTGGADGLGDFPGSPFPDQPPDPIEPVPLSTLDQHGDLSTARPPAAAAAARATGHAAAVAHMGAHARGVPAYAAKAAGLAAPQNPTAAAGEVRWALDHASPTVPNALRQLHLRPAPGACWGRSSATCTRR